MYLSYGIDVALKLASFPELCGASINNTWIPVSILALYPQLAFTIVGSFKTSVGIYDLFWSAML